MTCKVYDKLEFNFNIANNSEKRALVFTCIITEPLTSPIHDDMPHASLTPYVMLYTHPVWHVSRIPINADVSDQFKHTEFHMSIRDSLNTYHKVDSFAVGNVMFDTYRYD